MGIKPWDPWENLTLKEALLYHDAKVLESWDHTALIASNVYNVAVTVANANGSKAKARSMEHFHPYRATTRRGLVINQDNFQLLRQVFGAVYGRRRR